MVYTAPIYPTNLPDLTDLCEVVDDVDDILAARHNDPVKELIAVCDELGVLPKGNFSTVVDRLDDIYPQYHYRGAAGAVDFTIGQLTADNSYHDLTFDSICPAGSKVIHLQATLKSPTVNSFVYMTYKGDGSSKNVNFYRLWNVDTILGMQFFVPCDEDRAISYALKNVAWTTVNFTVIGWVK